MESNITPTIRKNTQKWTSGIVHVIQYLDGLGSCGQMWRTLEVGTKEEIDILFDSSRFDGFNKV